LSRSTVEREELSVEARLETAFMGQRKIAALLQRRAAIV